MRFVPAASLRQTGVIFLYLVVGFVAGLVAMHVFNAVHANRQGVFRNDAEWRQQHVSGDGHVDEDIGRSHLRMHRYDGGGSVSDATANSGPRQVDSVTLDCFLSQGSIHVPLFCLVRIGHFLIPP